VAGAGLAGPCCRRRDALAQQVHGNAGFYFCHDSGGLFTVGGWFGIGLHYNTLRLDALARQSWSNHNNIA